MVVLKANFEKPSSISPLISMAISHMITKGSVRSDMADTKKDRPIHEEDPVPPDNRR